MTICNLVLGFQSLSDCKAHNRLDKAEATVAPKLNPTSFPKTGCTSLPDAGWVFGCAFLACPPQAGFFFAPLVPTISREAKKNGNHYYQSSMSIKIIFQLF